MESSNSFVEFWRNVWSMLVSSNILQLVWALVILLVGWGIALVVSRLVGKALNRIGVRKHLQSYTEPSSGASYFKVERVITRVVFWTILLIAVMASLTTLNLSEAAAPIQDFVRKITGYAPHLIAAGLLVFVAWIVASVLQFLAGMAMKAMNFDEKYSVKDRDGNLKPLTPLVGNVVYWVVFLFFIPAILRTLRIDGITGPLENMFTKLLDFLPNLLAAGAILFFGLLVAKIIRRAVTGLMVVGQMDRICTKAGCTNVLNGKGFSYLAGLVAYALVAIPVLISALSALKIQALSDTVAVFYHKILNATGDVIGAAVLIFAAFVVGTIVAGIVTQLLEGFGFDRLIARMGFGARTETAVKPSGVVGKIVLIAILFMATIAACDLLGFHTLGAIVLAFMLFGGQLLIGIIVMMIGIYLANLAAGMLRGRGEGSEMMAQIVRIAVLVFTGAIALSTLNLNGGIIQLAFGLMLGAVAVAFAIAFGLGGREVAARKLTEWTDKMNRK